jgi:aerobic carbon-monoxide dehydrogenase small subunit
MTAISTTINGEPVRCHVPDHTLLSDLLRDHLGLTGTKVSCGVQVCGACTVLVDGDPVSSCAYLAVDVVGRTVETIEGMANGVELHPIQRAFADCSALQCGFCTPGFVMTVKALLAAHPDPSDAEVSGYLSGNLCRCTGYGAIAEAVRVAADTVREVDGDA